MQHFPGVTWKRCHTKQPKGRKMDHRQEMLWYRRILCLAWKSDFWTNTQANEDLLEMYLAEGRITQGHGLNQLGARLVGSKKCSSKNVCLGKHH